MHLCAVCPISTSHKLLSCVTLIVHTRPFIFALLSFLSHGTRMKLRNISTTCKAANKVTCAVASVAFINMFVCYCNGCSFLLELLSQSCTYGEMIYCFGFDRPLVALLLRLLAFCQFWSLFTYCKADIVVDKLLKQA